MSPLSIVARVVAEEKPRFDPNSVTPGVIGFFAIFAVILIVVLLARDMARRIRRTQYRAEVGERLDAEAAALAESDEAGEDGSSGDTSSNDDGVSPR